MEYVAFLVFAIIIGLFLIRAGSGLAEWMRNNGLPVLSVPARLVTKRTETDGNMNSSTNRVYTTYYATFELPSGQRLEFTLEGNAYGMLAEGDTGTLTYQGTRYHGFQRQH